MSLFSTSFNFNTGDEDIYALAQLQGNFNAYLKNLCRKEIRRNPALSSQVSQWLEENLGDDDLATYRAKVPKRVKKKSNSESNTTDNNTNNSTNNNINNNVNNNVIINTENNANNSVNNTTEESINNNTNNDINNNVSVDTTTKEIEVETSSTVVEKIQEESTTELDDNTKANREFGRKLVEAFEM